MAKKELTKKSDRETKESKKGTDNFSFVNNTKEELAKVIWPSRQQLLSESAAVILMVILVTTIISLVDKFFTWGAGKVFG